MCEKEQKLTATGPDMTAMRDQKLEDLSFGKLLRALRLQTGPQRRGRGNWSQQEVAAEVGVDTETYGRWERDEHRPRPQEADQLIGALNALGFLRSYEDGYGPLSWQEVDENLIRTKINQPLQSRRWSQSAESQQGTEAEDPEHATSSQVVSSRAESLQRAKIWLKHHRLVFFAGMAVLPTVIGVLVFLTVGNVADDAAETTADASDSPVDSASSSASPIGSSATRTTAIEACAFESYRPHLVRDPTTPGLTANILQPANCATGLAEGVGISAGGTFQGDLNDRELWILIWPPNAQYYPQSRDSCRGLPAQAVSGRWHVPIYLSEPGHPVEQFDIVLVAATDGGPASETFRNWLVRSCAVRAYSRGIIQLPEDNSLVELDAITVRTR